MITLRVFEKGEIILKENDTDEKAYHIEKGKVEVFITRNGKDIALHILGPGESVGEMSIIDDKPYSASVRALEETTAKELNREDFIESLDPVSDLVKNILRGLFQRLRNANNLIARYEEELLKKNGDKGSGSELGIRPIENATAADTEVGLTIEGITPEAKEALSGQVYQIPNFPFRIGRMSSDPMANNHLGLEDSKPYHVSRHHIALIHDQGKLGVLDSGSHLGTLVNGQKIGGKEGGAGPVYFSEGENTLVLGEVQSRFQFTVRME